MTENGTRVAEFFAAAARGDDAAVEKAVAADPELLDARDGSGLTAVLVAAYNRHPRLGDALAMRKEAGPTGLDIFEAAAAGKLSRVRKLLDEGAAVDDRAADGFTALHLAAFFGRLDVARLLLERGADPNAPSTGQMRVTPLHSAVSGRHRDLASLLLALGASANAVQHGGWTPLHTAARDGDEAIVNLLLLREADPTRPSDDGRTPADMAAEAGHGAIAEELREAAKG